jgi:hypothetical protein
MQQPYWRRWVGRAAFQASHRFGLAAWAIQAGGPVIAAWAVANYGPDEFRNEASVQARWLFIGLGPVVAVFLLLFLWQMLLAPSELEKDAVEQAEKRVRDDPHLVIEVEVTGALELLDDGSQARDKWLADVRAAYMTAQRKHEPRGKKSHILGDSVFEEQRSPGEYGDQVDAYLAEMKSGWPAFLKAAAARRDAGATTLVVTNRGTQHLEDVQLLLKLPPSVAISAGGENVGHEALLPSAPRPFGFFRFASAQPAALDGSNGTHGIDVSRDAGGLAVRLPVFDLRVGEPYKLVCLSVHALASAGESIQIDWSASARNISGPPAHGPARVLCSPTRVSPHEVFGIPGEPRPK